MRVLKKSAIILALFLSITANAYAVNIVDTATCKKIVLRVNQKVILVRRLTGKVAYVQRSNGEWLLLKGREKKTYQMLYNAQAAMDKNRNKAD